MSETIKTVDELIASAKREVALRKRAYPRWVENGRMKREMMEHEIACMQGIIRVLCGVRNGEYRRREQAIVDEVDLGGVGRAIEGGGERVERVQAEFLVSGKEMYER